MLMFIFQLAKFYFKYFYELCKQTDKSKIANGTSTLL